MPQSGPSKLSFIDFSEPWLKAMAGLPTKRPRQQFEICVRRGRSVSYDIHIESNLF